MQLSLFLDVLKCLCSDLTEDEFIGGGPPASGPLGAMLQRGRKELWRILRGTVLSLGESFDASPTTSGTRSDLHASSSFPSPAYVPGGSYDYMTLSGKEHILRLSRDPTQGHALSHIQVFKRVCRPVLEGSHAIRWSLLLQVAVSDGGRIINSVLEAEVTVATGAVVQHCHLQVRCSQGRVLFNVHSIPSFPITMTRAPSTRVPCASPLVVYCQAWRRPRPPTLHVCRWVMTSSFRDIVSSWAA